MRFRKLKLMWFVVFLAAVGVVFAVLLEPQMRHADRPETDTSSFNTADDAKNEKSLAAVRSLDKPHVNGLAEAADDAVQTNLTVNEIVQQLADESSTYSSLVTSIRTLKAINSAESRALLRQIAVGEFKSRNRNIETAAARSLLDCDRSEAWTLLSSRNRDVLTTALNTLKGLPVGREQMPLLHRCLNNESFLVQWCAAGVLAGAPSGGLASEAALAIAHKLEGVKDIQNHDLDNPLSNNVDIVHTLGESNYERLYFALAMLQVNNNELREIARQQQGRARDAVLLSLAHRGDTSVRESIIKLAQDSEAGLFRAWAVHYLGGIGNPDDLAMLKVIAKSDSLVRKGPLPAPRPGIGPVYPVREAAEQSILQIERKIAGR